MNANLMNFYKFAFYLRTHFMALPNANSDKTKATQVAEMFDNIAPKYDFLNHSLSLGIDKIWRRRTIKMVRHKQNASILDIATGTGDLAIALLKNAPESIIGIDISEGMLAVGKEKIKKLNVSDKITLLKGDSESIAYNDNTFDVITCAFGVRNFENLEKGLAEIYRVLKPGGVIAILEFSVPERFPFKQIYKLYFTKLLPFFGKIVSKNNNAYSYLPNSVYEFPYGNKFIEILKNKKFLNTKLKSLSFGIASIYYAEK